MNINEKRQSQALIMEITDRLDASTSPELEKKLKALFDKEKSFLSLILPNWTILAAQV